MSSCLPRRTTQPWQELDNPPLSSSKDTVVVDEPNAYRQVLFPSRRVEQLDSVAPARVPLSVPFASPAYQPAYFAPSLGVVHAGKDHSSPAAVFATLGPGQGQVEQSMFWGLEIMMLASQRTRFDGRAVAC
ncbi:uncharacterized protein C8Q71DRAFT_854897 [Rhodofomes roseus]|uniref:Uncharacterized protein n=1 Tax=Rhodofomes roseus TaxID=34475 RepID=A0ABQ8KQY7_9APHY|nr:uncharacterized protein C8Q71DRAFT_854897 [Rhodofomes roseus]KAH9841038.1 hypothetical protein C8Q71DRAFT_854897 [Rhodofomes roseus]